MHPSRNKRALGWLLLTIVAVAAQLVLAGGAAADEPKPGLIEEPLSFVVDESLEPVGGAREGVATLADPHGDRSDFAADELIVVTDDQKALDELLSRRNGKLLRSFDPAEYGYENLRPRYLVHIEPSKAEPERLASNLEALGVEARGEHRLSSEEALGLFAVAAEETLEGMSVNLNWLAQGMTLRTRTTRDATFSDSSIVGYVSDAFRWSHLANGTVQDTGISEAWNLLARAKRLPNPGVGPAIGILDGGFERFDPDIPAGSVQLSVGPNPPGACSGGANCFFHGMNVTSTAMGLVDNSFGGAGAGGPVARAIQLSNGGNIFGTDTGMITLQARGARVINMSFGGTIPAAATAFTGGNLNVTADAVRTRGAMLVASAGNANTDVDAVDCFIGCWEAAYHWPCETAGVTCVGGLGVNSKARQASAPLGFSNFAGGRNFAGSGTVDIWAPWLAFSVVDSRDVVPDPNTVKAFTGTSASAPIVSGVAALVLAAKPTFTPADVENALLTTAQPGIGGVSLTIDAEAAVTSALLPNLPPDIRIIQPLAGNSVPRGWVRLRANATDREDGTPQQVKWFIDGTLQPVQGPDVVVSTHGLSFGLHHISAEAVDSGLQSVPDADGGFWITLTNTAPTVAISKPTNGSVFYIYRNYLQGGWTGDAIDLAGTSSDPNNSPAALPDRLVFWTRNGNFLRAGHVASVNALDLGFGTHTITFQGRDDEGLWAVPKSVTIEVKEWRPIVACPPLTIC